MDKQTRDAYYLELQKQLWTERAGSFARFDQTILTLSGGALTLSLTFIKDVVPASRPVQICLRLRVLVADAEAVALA